MTEGRGVKVALSWLPALLYTALIWWLSSQSLQVKAIEVVPFRDKGAHLLEYAGLSLAIAHAVFTTWPGRGLRAGLAVIWITVGLGLIDELHQLFVPDRQGDVRDLGADALGAVLGVVLYGMVQLAVLRRRRAYPSARGGR
jgi:VanZ family protein